MSDSQIPKNDKLLETARKLLREMTRHERHLWYDFLRTYPIKKYKQRIIGNYGHLSNIVSAKTVEHLIKKGTKNFILAHLSEDNNLPSLALETVKSLLYTNNIDLTDVSIKVAKP